VRHLVDLGRGTAVGVTHSAKDAATPTRITSTTPGSTKRRACCAAAVGALDGATSS
jgi:hypothetical protein